MPTTKATKEAAQQLGVSVGTMRNWSDQYGEYLSETARPGHQPERRFNDHDLTILAYVKQLRSEGMQAEQIRTRLDETTFNDVEIIAQQTTVEGPIPQQTSPELHSASILPLVALNDLENRLARLEASRQDDSPMVRHGLAMLALGILIGLGIALLFVALAYMR